MPIGGSSQPGYTVDFYALNGPWVDPTSQDELEAMLIHLRTYLRSMVVMYSDPSNSQASIDWRLLRDTILPLSQEWVDSQLSTRYNVPLKKTKKDGTQYDRNIVNLAALAVAEILENRTYAGSAMPNQSERGAALLTDRDSLLSDIKAMRLRGQRLKASDRTFDPNMEPVPSPGQGSAQGKTNYQPRADTPVV